MSEKLQQKYRIVKTKFRNLASISISIEKKFISAEHKINIEIYLKSNLNATLQDFLIFLSYHIQSAKNGCLLVIQDLYFCLPFYSQAWFYRKLQTIFAEFNISLDTSCSEIIKTLDFLKTKLCVFEVYQFDCNLIPNKDILCLFSHLHVTDLRPGFGHNEHVKFLSHYQNLNNNKKWRDELKYFAFEHNESSMIDYCSKHPFSYNLLKETQTAELIAIDIYGQERILTNVMKFREQQLSHPLLSLTIQIPSIFPIHTWLSQYTFSCGLPQLASLECKDFIHVTHKKHMFKSVDDYMYKSLQQLLNNHLIGLLQASIQQKDMFLMAIYEACKQNIFLSTQILKTETFHFQRLIFGYKVECIELGKIRKHLILSNQRLK